MSHEIELRLSARQEHLERLSQNPLMQRLSQAKASTRCLNTVYYDTPDFVLAKNGISLRVRRFGRQFVQTVKEKNTGAIVSDRTEWESPLPSAKPDLRFIADPKTRKRLLTLAGNGKIKAILESEIQRTTRQLKTDTGDEIECATDRGEIRTLVNGKKTLRISEVELELKTGSPAALYEIAHSLAENAHFKLAIESKSQRGLRVLEGRRITATKPGRMVLPLGATAEDSFRICLMHCLRHIARNTPVVSEEKNVDGLHQLRVGLRRLRAALEVFGNAFDTAVLRELSARAKSFSTAFGKTRDLDVFATELFPLIEAATPDHLGLAALRAHLEATRSASWLECAKLANSGAFTCFLLDLAAAAESRIWRQGAGPKRIAAFARPAKGIARKALDKGERKLLKRAKNFSDLNAGQRHRLRIALKKLRYAAEFFAPLYAQKPVSKYLKIISEVQDVFGVLNDASTVNDSLSNVLANTPLEKSSALREGIAFALGWNVARIEPAWKDAKTRWKRLAKSKNFWAV